MPRATAITELPIAILRLFNARPMKSIGLLVGAAMTLAKASSEAPGGIRSRPSGRARFRGSSAMLKIQTSGKSTVDGDEQQDRLQDDLSAEREPAFTVRAPSTGDPPGQEPARHGGRGRCRHRTVSLDIVRAYSA